jgi:5'-3' exonuclease
MGVPAYFYVLCQKYRNILRTEIAGRCGTLCLDFNGVIHQAANSMNGQTDADLIERVWTYFIDIVDVMKPVIGVRLYIDGCAPLAKQMQQRRRRYLTVRSNSQGAQSNASTSSASWDRNAISPGTAFMDKLNAFLAEKVFSKALGEIDLFVSGSDEAGEGEHKLFDWIRHYGIRQNSNIVVYGLDADLIMLSLLSKTPNISLMREITVPEQQHARTVPQTPQTTQFQYLDIDTLSQSILQEYPFLDIESYITLCFFLGNDFLPNIACIQMRRGGIDTIINAFKTVKAAVPDFGSLVDIDISFEKLQLVVAQLAVDEDRMLREVNEDYLRRKPYNDQDIRSYPVFPQNKSPLAQLIRETDISKWRGLYYKHLFNTRLHDGRIIVTSCKQYIEGIRWIFDYYRGLPKNETWYYPYDYAPTLKDLANNWAEPEMPTEVQKIPPRDTNIQLLSILPPESVNLLPVKLRPFMTDVSKGALHLFPRPHQYRLQTYLKTQLHECNPILPAMDVSCFI